MKCKLIDSVILPKEKGWKTEYFTQSTEMKAVFVVWLVENCPLVKSWNICALLKQCSSAGGVTDQNPHLGTRAFLPKRKGVTLMFYELLRAVTLMF